MPPKRLARATHLARSSQRNRPCKRRRAADPRGHLRQHPGRRAAPEAAAHHRSPPTLRKAARRGLHPQSPLHSSQHNQPKRRKSSHRRRRARPLLLTRNHSLRPRWTSPRRSLAALLETHRPLCLPQGHAAAIPYPPTQHTGANRTPRTTPLPRKQHQPLRRTHRLRHHRRRHRRRPKTSRSPPAPLASVPRIRCCCRCSFYVVILERSEGSLYLRWSLSLLLGLSLSLPLLLSLSLSLLLLLSWPLSLLLLSLLPLPVLFRPTKSQPSS